MSPDPLGGSLLDPQSLNKYSYVRNSPLTLVDPTGMSVCDTLGSEDCMLAQAQCNGNFFGNCSQFSNSSCRIDGIGSSCGIAFSAIANGAGARCPDDQCDGVNMTTNLPVRFVATSQGTYDQCSAPGYWGSQSAAGQAAVICANGESIALNRELIGNIYRTASGQYSFTSDGPQGTASASYDPNAIPDGTQYAGFYHTHGAFDLHYYSEQFSPPPNDIGIALSGQNRGFPTYLGTPLGRLEMFDPSQAGFFPWGCVLKGPPVVPGPGISAVQVPACP